MKLNKGQALVEAVVAVGVITLLVTGLLVGMTNSLKSGEFSRYKSQASKYAQEGVELSRAQRDAGWTNFFTTYGNAAGGRLFCLDGNGVWTVTPKNRPCAVNINNFFTRSVLFTWQNPLVVVLVTVSWKDGANTHQTTLTTYLTQWK